MVKGPIRCRRLSHGGRLPELPSAAEIGQETAVARHVQRDTDALHKMGQHQLRVAALPGLASLLGREDADLRNDRRALAPSPRPGPEYVTSLGYVVCCFQG